MSSQTTKPASAPSHGLDTAATFVATDALAAVSALLVETGLIWVVARNNAFLPLALLGHAGVVTVLIGRAWHLSRIGRDGSAALLLALLVAMAGPVAALGGLVLDRMARQGPGDRARLESWYARISFSTEVSQTAQLSDRITSGRVADHADAMPSSFLGVLASGSIHEQQVILGLIARRFHPDYLPALQLALGSDEPVIRVQAAAVAARIRGDLAALTETILHAAADPTAPQRDVVRLIGEAERCVASGLLEEPDKLRSIAIIDGLVAAAADRLDRRPGTLHDKATEPLLPRYEAHLLQQCRYADFRRLRREQAWRARGAARFRLLRQCAMTSGGSREAAS